jgi:hypothetical protein
MGFFIFQGKPSRRVTQVAAAAAAPPRLSRLPVAQVTASPRPCRRAAQAKLPPQPARRRLGFFDKFFLCESEQFFFVSKSDERCDNIQKNIVSFF